MDRIFVRSANKRRLPNVVCRFDPRLIQLFEGKIFSLHQHIQMRMPGRVVAVIGNLQSDDAPRNFSLPAHRSPQARPARPQGSDPLLQILGISLSKDDITKSVLSNDERLSAFSDDLRSPMRAVGTHANRAGILSLSPIVIFLTAPMTKAFMTSSNLRNQVRMMFGLRKSIDQGLLQLVTIEKTKFFP